MRNILKKTFAALLYAVYRLLDPFVRFNEASVLAYHSISNDANGLSIPLETLERQLTTLQDSGYAFVSVDQLVESLAGSVLPRKAVALTFDDGYADLESALPIFERFKAPAAVFLIGEEAAARSRLGNSLPLVSPEMIERLRAHPLVTLGYHTRSHANLAQLSGAALKAEIEPRFGARYFAYPGGNYSPEAMRAVEAAGYSAAFSIKPTLVTKASDRFLLPRAVITKTTDVRFVVSRAAAWYRSLATMTR